MAHRHESRTLRDVLEGRGPSLTVVRGGPGAGKTTLLREALAALPDDTLSVRHACLPLTDPDQRAELLRGLSLPWPDAAAEGPDGEPAGRSPSDGPSGADAGGELPDWPAIVDALSGWLDAHRRPLVLVLDDAERALAARSGVGAHLEELWRRARARALPLHLVLSGRPPGLDEELERAAPGLAEASTEVITLGPLGLREVARRLPGYDPEDRLRAWAIFGGSPDRAHRVDPSVTLATNVRQLVLEPGSPLLRAGLEVVEGSLQTPARYVSLLRALATGARDWGELRRACATFETGSQMAPYVHRLEALGLVEVRRSLDASARGRNRRYELSDPFLGFWYRCVLPLVGEAALAGRTELWSRSVKPRLDAHVAAVLPSGLRGWLRDHGDEVLPERARVAGALWGDGYDLELAGTLHNGAVFYGECRWSSEPTDASAFEGVHRQLRRTRYGFGREGRHRIVFARGRLTGSARRAAARDPLVHALGVEDLVGP